ncbi:unnamed protein product [Ambrosiozyma monospora]|uniref:Unnamed protein product n=1 Tax=Ambrosiozyma monospora TaxID=43982 RepID=A0ACB5SY37_AMBMO|nr:unnamed protein product [Ambrosiozyma monospora]
MEKVLSEKLSAIESEKPVKDYEVNEVVNDQFKYQNEKMKELYRILGTYNVIKKGEYEKLLEGIQSEYKVKFKKNITYEEQIKHKKVCAFDRYKKSISFKEYKAQKQKSLEGELSEKKKKEEEEALRLKLETEETKRREAAEAEARAQAESEAQAHAAGTQQQPAIPIPGQPSTGTTTATAGAPPTAELPGIDPHQPPLPPVPTAAADGEHPNGYHDPFGNDNANNFEFDNNLLYGGGDDLMIPEDGNGAEFGALDDQVFLMDGNMEDAYTTPNPYVYGANMPAGANHENNTHQTERASGNPLGGTRDGQFGVPTETAGKYPTYVNKDGVVIEFTPERRKKMLRNLYIISAILVIIYTIVWIVAVAVTVSKANCDHGEHHYHSY